ncbi:unnamed protein product [Paramecium pentaurelia]|uniref:Pentapeptide repeat-containing protein n=1 Tax=Paramecium pentaurelia TaxID=43138 RepID=A0A8S1TQ57_9CILI|nr:unnamed protein product [Paramecium pentaurelia]
MKVNFNQQSFENVRMKDTSLIGANLFQCTLSGSEFSYVDISGANLNGDLLFNFKWNNLKIQELLQLDNHNDYVRSICSLPVSSQLVSCSKDNSIQL